jgi:acyl-homoserine lactone synthase
MVQVHTITARNRREYAHYLEQHFRIRHEIYVGERRWMALQRPDGREVDQFDDEHAIYLLGIDETLGVVCGSRLVPTVRPHLMSDVFPELASIRGLQRAPDIFEWTRIFVVPARRASGRSCITAGIIKCGVLEHCLRQRIRTLSIVTETYWIPRFDELGWTPRPLGLPIQKDGMSIVGITVDITEHALEATRAFYGIEDRVTDDATKARRSAPKARMTRAPSAPLDHSVLKGPSRHD